MPERFASTGSSPQHAVLDNGRRRYRVWVCGTGWRSSLAVQQLAHQTLGHLGISAALRQNLEDETVMIDSPPEPVLLAADRNDGLVKVPFVTQPTG
jgi:hypothetical protein